MLQKQRADAEQEPGQEAEMAFRRDADRVPRERLPEQHAVKPHRHRNDRHERHALLKAFPLLFQLGHDPAPAFSHRILRIFLSQRSISRHQPRPRLEVWLRRGLHMQPKWRRPMTDLHIREAEAGDLEAIIRLHEEDELGAIGDAWTPKTGRLREGIRGHRSRAPTTGLFVALRTAKSSEPFS